MIFPYFRLLFMYMSSFISIIKAALAAKGNEGTQEHENEEGGEDHGSDKADCQWIQPCHLRVNAACA